MPRIIAGSAGGIRLKTAAFIELRPTADRVKEALFSILQPDWPPANFLDLFAGSGQIGLEAASRGVTEVLLVEDNPLCQKSIRENISRTGLAKAVRLYGLPADAFVRQARRKGQTFELIFADPPYRKASQEIQHLAPLLAELIRPDGLIIFEHDARLDPGPIVTNLQLLRCCQYGTAMLSFYKRE